MQDKIEKAFKWASERGLFIDPRIERRQVDGIYGMYATDTIPQGTLFASFPKDKLIPLDVYQENEDIPNHLATIAAAATELAKGEESEYFGCIAGFDEMDYLRETSIFFFSEQDLKTIEQMNPVVGFLVRRAYRVMHDEVEAVSKAYNSLDKDIITHAVLNKFCRSWSMGFVPVLDLFNHSDRKGTQIKQVQHMDQKRVGYVARQTYEKGDQIYISYGRKDVALVASLYNYFDPTGPHFIDYAERAIRAIKSDFAVKQCQKLAQKYQCSVHELGGEQHFCVNEKEMLFTEQAPTMKLIEYFKDSSYENEAQLNAGKVPPGQVLNNMYRQVNSYLQANQVDQFKLKDLPPKLHRFYHLLKKEKTILEANLDWILDNMDM